MILVLLPRGSSQGFRLRDTKDSVFRGLSLEKEDRGWKKARAPPTALARTGSDAVWGLDFWGTVNLIF